MLRTTKYFLVTPEIAERAGVLESRYHTTEGLMVLNEQDMGRVRLQPEEYLTGVVERVITEEEAKKLIAEAGSKTGRLVEESNAGATEGSPVTDSEAEVVTPGKEVTTPEEEVTPNEEAVVDEELAAEVVTNDNNEAEEGLNNE